MHRGDPECGHGTLRQQAADRDYLQVAAGEAHTCAITDDARAFCWGEGEGGRLGTGNEEDRLTPQAVVTGLSFVRVTAGMEHSCARTGDVAEPAEPGDDGDPFCWGVGVDGRLGNGTTNTQLTPLRVTR